jgi:hypothetical protein
VTVTVPAVLTVGDTAPALTGTVNANLASATMRANIRRPDKTVFSRTATAVSAAAGTWTTTLQTGDLNQAGDYYVELEVTFAGGAIQTFSLDPTGGTESRFHVRSQYA